MDPNANLAEQDQIAQLPKQHNYDRYRLYDLRVALRDWLASGGFEPDWAKYPAGTASYRKWAGIK